MQKINWKSKLTSRKFWAAIVSFVALLVVACGGTQEQAAQITAIIMAGATVVAYIIGEGLVDAAAASTIVSAEPIAPLIGTVAPNPVEGAQTAADKAVADNTASNPPTDTKAE